MKRKTNIPIAPQYRSPIPPPLLTPEPADAILPAAAEPVKHRRRHSRWEKVLLGVELIILAAILLIIAGTTKNWLILRQALPTDGITIITQQVLAAPPTDTIPTFNDGSNLPLGTLSAAEQSPAAKQAAEIPEHLRGLIFPREKSANIAIAKPAAEPGVRVSIPSINVDAPIGEGTDWESLKFKVGHHPGTANPGERGNMVLAAHNDVFGELFRYLPDVPVGEVITVQTENQIFRYRITERRIILPTETEVMLPTTDPTITLISCYPYLIDTHRIVLFGELVG